MPLALTVVHVKPVAVEASDGDVSYRPLSNPFCTLVSSTRCSDPVGAGDQVK
jgi:hypothetical protein